MTELINVNSAQPEVLTCLPGIGPAIANRIVAARPFEAIDDLLQVRGVGPALLERLGPLVTLAEPVPEQEVIFLGAVTETPPEAEADTLEMESPPETESESPDLEADPLPREGLELEVETDPEDEIIPTEKAIIKVETEEPEAEKPAAGPRPVTRGQAFFMAAGCSFVAFILALLLSIGTIGGLNGGLRFASPDQVVRLTVKIGALNDQIEIVAGDVESVRTRIDSLAGLSGRVGDLETASEELSASTEELSTNMEITANLVERLNAQIEEITFRTEKFQAFLDGLGRLLSDLTTISKETP